MAASPTGFTALMLAAREGCTHVVEWLLTTPYEVAVRSDDAVRTGRLGLHAVRSDCGHTAWHLACMAGHQGAAMELQRAGCDVCARVDDEGGRTALHLACEAGETQLVEWLLGVSDRVPVGASCTRAFKDREARLRCSKLLETRDAHGETAFHVACENGHLGCAKALGRAGCNTEAKNLIQSTAKELAADEGQDDVVQWLRQLARERTTARLRDRAATRRLESEQMHAEGQHRAAAARWRRLLRQAPEDGELQQLLAEAERLAEEAEAAGEVRARAAEAELLALLEDGEGGGGAAAGPGDGAKSKAQKKRERQRQKKEEAEFVQNQTMETLADDGRQQLVLAQAEQKEIAARDEISVILAQLELSEHLPVFLENEIDMSALPPPSPPPLLPLLAAGGGAGGADGASGGGGGVAGAGVRLLLVLLPLPVMVQLLVLVVVLLLLLPPPPPPLLPPPLSLPLPVWCSCCCCWRWRP